MIDCQYYKGGCELGLFGGKPLPDNCRECILAGENNAAYAEKLREAHARSHPSTAPRVSGCCDSAENP